MDDAGFFSVRSFLLSLSARCSVLQPGLGIVAAEKNCKKTHGKPATFLKDQSPL